MRLATIVGPDGHHAAVVAELGVLRLELPEPGFGSLRAIAAGGGPALARVRAWVDAQPDSAYRPPADVELGPAVPDPGAIYTIGQNYRAPDASGGDAPERPLVYGKAPTSVAGTGAVLAWDRSITANVDAEVELGVVIGVGAFEVAPRDAMDHVLGYTVINDVSSRDPWLDGDQWLLGKSMPGFCPVGPWIVTRDEVDVSDLRLGCTINGVPIQDGRTSSMRFPVPDVIAYLSRHAMLRPGDLIATGTPVRLASPPGPDRRLAPGDRVTAWIERIGELTTTIA